MNKWKRKNLLELYNEISERVESEIEKSPKAYIADFFVRKASLDTSAVKTSIIATFIINVLWQTFVMLFFYPIASAAAEHSLPQLFIVGVAISLTLLLSSVIVVVAVYSNKRQTCAEVLLEEHLLKQKGYL